MNYMPDTIHDNVGSLPVSGSFTHVAGYTSGTPDIQWTNADWLRYPNKVHVRIEQGYGGFIPDMSSYDGLDVERGAWTPQTAAEEIVRRALAGYPETFVYANDGDLANTVAAVGSFNPQYLKKMSCGLANWNDSAAEAEKIVGTLVHGVVCRYVQFASPSSNPNTLIPGTGVTLAQANCDLSVVQASWNPVVVPKRPPVSYEEEDMRIVRVQGQPEVYLATGSGLRHIPTTAILAELITGGVPEMTVSAASLSWLLGES